MENQEQKKNTTVGQAPQKSASSGAPVQDSRGPRREFKKNPRRMPKREARAKPEFDHRVVSIRRVTRVVAGGKRMNFSVAVVAGNRKGSVGFGIGKAADTSLAIEKALRNAKKHIIALNLTKEMSLPHEVDAKYASSRVIIMPARGRGLVAGSSVRNVLELAGIKDVTAKLLSRSKNKINNAMVAIKALGELSLPKKHKVSEQKEVSN